MKRARAVATVLGRIAGVQLVPDPPHTNMMHVLLPGDPELLMDESAAIARDESVCLFTRARASGVPGLSLVEITIGEAARNRS